MPNWHPKNTQKGMVLIWMIVWLAGMAAIYYWCVLKHIPAIEQRIQSNAQTALTNGGHESINVTVSDRIATLSGAVSTETERSNIVNAVSAAAGVRSVNDGLTLLAQSSTEGNTDGSTDTNTETASTTNDNIVAKAVIPATPKPAETNTDTQDSAATSADNQTSTQDTGSADKADDLKDASTEKEASTDSSNAQSETPADTQKITAADNTAAMTTDTQPTVQNTVEPDTQTASNGASASDTHAAADELVASNSTSTAENSSSSENVTAPKTNDSDAASTASNDSSDAQNDVAATATDSDNAADATTSDIENKANERIQEALAKQEQTQTNTPTEQAEPAAVQMLSPTLNLQVNGNSIIISGDISENDDALDLIESAMSTFDTPIVVNQMQAHQNRSAAPWLNDLAGFLPIMQGIENAGIRINEQQIVLSGNATSEGAHDEVINQALSSLPTLSLVERMRVVAPKAEKKAEVAKSDVQAVTPAPSSSSSIEDFFADYNKLKNTTILFESGSDVLTEDSVEIVIQIADVLNNHTNVKIGIDGHTDNAGNSDTNLRLSQARSNAVRDTLIDQGVDVERINAYGFGDSVPIADNSTPEGRRLNRRIEFNFKLDQSR